MSGQSKRTGVMTSGEIRQSFLDFFRAHDHTIVHSMSLVPGGDETLLFTNSGMVQFKDVFLGTGRRPYSRVANSQKCMRVAGKHNDLDDVGRDDSHHTFFEMLGNWSFGDYYKREAIAWAWELLTDVWGLPKDRFWATCFEDELGEIPRDDEAADYWVQQPGFDPAQVVFFGRGENFWEMAETGPCGPDSELHMDLGPKACNMGDVPGHECQVNGDCSRFLELWNLVFIQYNRVDAKILNPLPSKHVDTGMGFERLVSVLQGVDSNYQTDLFSPIIETTRKLAGHTEEQVQAFWTPYRVIADHARAAAFLIADGVVPGNLGRNYVTRMIIRRGSLFGGKLGFNEPFLAEIARKVIEHYQEAYPELEQNREGILRAITDEEHRFQRTVEAATAAGDEVISETEAVGEQTIPGASAFALFSTYGLPLEIFRDMAAERGLQVDEGGFESAMENHRLISAGTQGEGLGGDEVSTPEAIARYQVLLEGLRASGALGEQGVRYDPYGDLEFETSVVGLEVEEAAQESATSGDRVAAVLVETHFYVEAGGQVSDTGTLRGADGSWEIAVLDTRKPVDGLVIHLGTVARGEPKVGDQVLASVEGSRRWDIMRNHTATHLLHAALREVLGSHARQAGSLVAPDRLRFDFTHPDPVSADELERIEHIVNGDILANYKLLIRQQPREEAIHEGAMALFGETYGETVRTICIGESCHSYELCGGTHVPSTAVIGPFLITGESSVASGIRRIEAVTGRGSLELIRDRLGALERMAARIGAAPAELESRLGAVLEERARLQRELSSLHEELALEHFRRLAPEIVQGVPVLTGSIPESTADELRRLIDLFRAEHESGVAVLASAPTGRPVIVAAITSDLVERGLHAGDLAKAVAAEVGGGGGGKPTIAQAGGTDPSRLPEALALVAPWVESHLG